MFDIGEHDFFYELGAVRATPYGSDVVFSNSERKVPIHIGAGTSPASCVKGLTTCAHDRHRSRVPRRAVEELPRNG
jgi:hypothetical protein